MVRTWVAVTMTGVEETITPMTEEATAEVTLVEETTIGTEDRDDTVVGTTLVETTGTGIVVRVLDTGLLVETATEVLVVEILAEEMGVTTCEAMVQGQLDFDSTISLLSI